MTVIELGCTWGCICVQLGGSIGDRVERQDSERTGVL